MYSISELHETTTMDLSDSANNILFTEEFDFLVPKDLTSSDGYYMQKCYARVMTRASGQ